MLVAGHGELLPDPLEGELFPRLEEEGVAGDVGPRAQPHQRRRRRHHGDVEIAALDPVKRGEPLRHQVLVRRELVVGKRLPVGEQTHAQLRSEPPQFLEQPLGVERACRDDRKRLFRLRQACERKRVG
jgi:hypothetical protein